MQKIILQNLSELPYALEEAINRLRVNISFLGKDVKKIMIISSVANEGKSLISMHLWRQMAESGTKSILLDADMRNSVLTENYDMKVITENGKKTKREEITHLGTSGYLSGDGPLEESIYNTQYEAGDIIPNFDNVINPSLLLESNRFKEMLNELGEKYRYVFIDAPPLDFVSDGERMGHLCDGAILVVRAGATPKRLVKNCIGQLERAGCPMLGIVLNRVDGSKGGYYSKYGGHYGSNSYYGKK